MTTTARFTEPVLDPTGVADMARDATFAPRPATLAGTTLGLLDNGKPNAALLLAELGEQLRHEYGLADVLSYRKGYFGTPVEDDVAAQIAERCDFAVAATGD